MPSRRTTLIALAALVGGPIAVQKLTTNLGPMIKGHPLLALNSKARVPGEFQFKDEGGAIRRLADYRGQFVLVNIWATWCPPCREEMPSLDRLKAALGSEPGIVVVPISVDRASAVQVRAFYNATGVKNLPLLMADQEETLTALRIAGLPTTLLLNREGLEVGRLVGPTKWDSSAVMEQLAAVMDDELSPLLLD